MGQVFFSQDAGDVVLDRSFGYVESGGNLFVRESVGYRFYDFKFPPGIT